MNSDATLGFGDVHNMYFSKFGAVPWLDLPAFVKNQSNIIIVLKISISRPPYYQFETEKDKLAFILKYS
jgi:hypothetical protein